MDVELLVLGRAVGGAPGRAEPRERPLARRDAALSDLALVGRPHALVVGVVDLFLVHVEPDDRSFSHGCSLLLGLRQYGSGRRRRRGRAGRSQKIAPVETRRFVLAHTTLLGSCTFFSFFPHAYRRSSFKAAAALPPSIRPRSSSEIFNCRTRSTGVKSPISMG